MAAPTVVGTPTSVTFTATTTVDITPDAGTAAGDLLLLIVSTVASFVSAAADISFTADPSPLLTATILRRVLAGGETGQRTITFGAAATGEVVAVTIRGADSLSPVPLTSGWDDEPSSDKVVALPITTTVDATRLLAAYGRLRAPAYATETMTSPSGMTERGDVASGGAQAESSVNAYLADEVFATAGATGPRVATRSQTTQTVNSNAVLLSLKPATPGVAPSFVQAKSASAFQEDTSLATAIATVTLDAAPSDGNVLYAIVSSVAAATRTLTPDPAGWTVIATGNNTTAGFRVYRRVASGDVAASVWTVSTDAVAGTADCGVSVIVVEYSGVDTTTPEDVVGAVITTATATTQSLVASVAAAHDDYLALAVMAYPATRTFTTPPGMTEVADPGGTIGLGVFTKEVDLGDTGVQSATLSTGVQSDLRQNIMYLVQGEQPSGTGAGTLPSLTGTAAGVAYAGTGVGAGMLPALTGEASGAQTQTATGAGTFPVLTGSATGQQTQTGIGVGSFQALSGVASGNADLADIGSATISDLRESATIAQLSESASIAQA